MKKILFAILLFSSVAFQLTAAKYNVYIANFSRESEVSQDVLSSVRNTVVSSMTSIDRVVVIDASTSDLVAKIREYETSEAALSDPTAHAALVQLGVDYILSGTVGSPSVISMGKGDSKTYIAESDVVLKLTKVSDGSLVKTANFSAMGYGDTSDEASSSCKIRKIFVSHTFQKWFALQATILPTDYDINAKKKAMKTCYIELGSDDGIKKNQKLDVFYY